MRNIKRTSLPLLLILLGIIACGLPLVPRVDENANSTAVAETLGVIIRMTQEAGSGVVLRFTEMPTAIPTSTFTPLPSSTWTPVPSSTWTPLPTSTFTPSTPMITVSTPTNCRLGPGKVYDMVGALLVGEWAQVYGRDPTGGYWYIRNPDAPNSFCWVWGEYATVTGPTYALPVLIPPPTPTPAPTSTATRTAAPSPDFDLSYAGLESCSGGFWVDVSMHNVGNVTFESVNLTIKDTVTSQVITTISDEFIDNSDCSSTVSKPKAAPGKAVVQSSPKFGYDPGGHKLKAVVTLCSLAGLNGVCATNTITFTP